MSTGLILSGGGARAAYQVGVLEAVAEILPRDVYNPFPIICGTSAGAVNAMAMAGRPGHFRLRVRKLKSVWWNLHANCIYRTDLGAVIYNTVKIINSIFNPWYTSRTPLAFLDNSPLRELLESLVRFRYIDEALASGELEALALTAMSYNTGQSVTFYQGKISHQPWERSRRISKRTGLTIDHLMASSALPTLFPATQIDGHYYADGALRLQKPLSPALHLGSERIFIIGVSDNPRHKPPVEFPDYPPNLGQVMGHLLNSVFIDNIEADLETLRMVNRLLEQIPEEQRAQKGLADLKPIDYLCISPSVPIDGIAGKYLHELPKSVRMFLRVTGVSNNGAANSAASYLLFEKGFCRELLSLGYHDAMQQRDEIREFFGMNQSASAPARPRLVGQPPSEINQVQGSSKLAGQ